MDLSFLDKLFIRQFNVQIRFKEEITFHFYHGPKIYGLVSRALNQHPIGDDVIIYTPESGRILYQPYTLYNFGITVLNEKSYTKENLLDAFRLLNPSDYPGDLNGDSVELVEITELETSAYKDFSGADNNYTLEIITPLRIERPDEDKEEGKTYFDLNYFDCREFFYRLFDRLLKLHKLSVTDHPLRVFPPLPKFELINTNFLWIDAPKNDSTIGGIVGKVEFNAVLDETWKKVLWLGQFTHAGRYPSFGLGKYLIAKPASNIETVKPVKTFFELSLNKQNFEDAFVHIKNNSDLPGVDGITPGSFEENFKENIGSFIKEIETGNYKSSDLKGIIIPKENSKIRALAVPTFKDRIFQRAVCQVLSLSFDHLLEENSFAYRKGFSRISASKEINTAYKNGYRYILESDIQSFFDNVDWQILFSKLDILLRNDPVLNIIKSWVAEDVVFEGTKIKRSKGLPQGAVVSPLLANLYLDEFDELLQDNFKLIRYADDFVILCKSKEEAEKALAEVKEALDRLELEIKPSKTKITTFKEGFQYLGYLFVQSLVLEKEKEDKLQNYKQADLRESIPDGSWLSFVDFSKTKTIPNKPVFQSVKTEEVIEEDYNKYPVYVTDFETSVHIEGNTVELIDEDRFDKDNPKFPVHEINSLIIIGASKITMPAVFKLNENGIPVYFCKPSGELKLAIPVHNPNYNVWFHQARLAEDAEFTLKFAKAIVEAKINNHKVLSRRIEGNELLIKKFDSLLRKTETAETLDSLRGIEGTSAVTFFDVFNNSLEDDWKFETRTKHPPEDRVNAMLSYGYTILYHYISTALQTEGLNPNIGWFHRPSERYFALASDIQEEFRHIIDSLIINMIHRNMVKLDDFVFNEKNSYPCLMTKNFRKLFIERVEERLKVQFTPPGSAKQISYRDFIHKQAQSIKKTAASGNLIYQPLRIR
ncbi:MAG: CRISPR-associated endonuclease Cas1 [Bacteroidota bacterium]